MSRLDPEKLHVRNKGVSFDVLSLPRCYTLTHSDRTGDLFLTIGASFDHEQISGLHTRLMRDEVLAEWKMKKGLLEFHVYLHVCGGFIFGTASLRETIFRRELPLALEAIRYGDREIFAKHPRLDQTGIIVHFNKPRSKDCKTELLGNFSKYKL